MMQWLRSTRNGFLAWRIVGAQKTQKFLWPVLPASREGSHGQTEAWRWSLHTGQAQSCTWPELECMEHWAILFFQTAHAPLPPGENPPKPKGHKYHKSQPETWNWQLAQIKASAASVKKGFDGNLRLYVTWARALKNCLQVTLQKQEATIPVTNPWALSAKQTFLPQAVGQLTRLQNGDVYRITAVWGQVSSKNNCKAP